MGVEQHGAHRALTVAKRYVRFGNRSTAELRAYLQERRVAERLIPAVIEEATRRGLLDDEACAKLCAGVLNQQGYAWAAVHEQLRAKGFTDEVVERILKPLQADADDATRARALVRSHLRDPSPRRRAWLARWLARRGFDPELIDEILAESCEPTSE